MIGFIGGTGHQGRALALRLAAAGEEVILGSRTYDKAEMAVDRIKAKKEGLAVFPATNEEVAKKAEVVFITLPYECMEAVLKPLKADLRGKIVVDVINPLTNNHSHKGVSASEKLQKLLGESKVVCAFKNVSSHRIGNLDEKVDVDSIVCSDFEDAKEDVIKLSERIGIPSIDGGGLENALTSELLTRFLLQLNKKHHAETGIKIHYYKV
jgi:NADPH-dependent F420 reductase